MTSVLRLQLGCVVHVMLVCGCAAIRQDTWCMNGSRNLGFGPKTEYALQNASARVPKYVEKFSNAQFSKTTILPKIEVASLTAGV